MTFRGNTWTAPGIAVIFEAGPLMKYADEVFLHNPGGSAIGDNSEAFMSNFAAMKSLHVWLDNDVFHHFSWTFLCQDYARELRRIKDLVRICATLPRLSGGEALELDFSENYSSRAFGQRIIEVLKGSRREVTFRMRTQQDDGELTLNEDDCTVDVDGATTRYASEKNGIVVEVTGCWVAI
ncbi:hypothetical protein AAVH_24415 [Aphelenchoides avenae]|nr:hypothetical protein AAVH_24415 [Aphelenchus avenae]